MKKPRILILFFDDKKKTADIPRGEVYEWIGYYHDFPNKKTVVLLECHQLPDDQWLESQLKDIFQLP